MIRFNTSYAVGAVVAIIHDVLISLGIFVLLGHELSLPVVGAILTVAGYSINDTIVIYDRIREGLKMGYKGTLEEVMNTCINLTLSRTLITAGTTFLAVLALYLFGGVVIQDFALILLVGIVVGTYSSIFIASPIALLLAKKKT
jgi:preprotein translocase SecF subunit